MYLKIKVKPKRQIYNHKIYDGPLKDILYLQHPSHYD